MKPKELLIMRTRTATRSPDCHTSYLAIRGMDRVVAQALRIDAAQNRGFQKPMVMVKEESSVLVWAGFDSCESRDSRCWLQGPDVIRESSRMEKTPDFAQGQGRAVESPQRLSD